MDRSSRYFGPYTSGLAIKDTLRMLRNIFPYCSNKKIGNKPCFFYHIGKCPGVCFGKISTQEYRDNYIKKIIQFLEGRQSQVLKDLQKQMRSFASHKQFEKAAKVRNQIFALNRVLERQKLVYPKKLDQDVFSVYTDLPAMPRVKQSDKAWQAGGVASINLFMIREGKLIQKENFIMENTKQVPVDEILQSFLERYYLEASSIPKEVLLPAQIIPDELYPVFIGRRFPKFTVPVQGQRLQLLKLGQENAKQYLESTTDKHLLEEARLLASLKELQRVLDLPNLPGRIEAYDISNIQGTNPVGSMVVFDFARPKKNDYRKFKINKKQTPDDFAMMSEMLDRRFKNSWPMPDLILIDGGKGQLSAATKVLSQIPKFSDSQIPTIGLAKRIEEIFTQGRKNPILLPPTSIGLFLLQRIRDEAHRFAVTYHRKLRSRKSLTSVLDSISGVGPNKKRQLLQKFGSAKQIRGASLTAIASIVGAKAAEKIKASL